MWQDLYNCVIDLNSCESTPELFTLFEEFTKKAGYEYYAFGNLYGDKKAIEDFPAPAITVNYPADWVQYYFEKKLYKIDPVVLLSPYASRYLDWAEIRKHQPTFFDEAKKFGLQSGLSIPLRSFDGCYVLSLSSKNEIILRPDQLSILEMFANQFFLNYLRLREMTHKSPSLSDNQIYAIQATMLGKRAKDIAFELNKSTHGVYFMLDEARKKMECDTVPQLIMKAVQQGIVVI